MRKPETISVNVRLTPEEIAFLDNRCTNITRKTGVGIARGTFFRLLLAQCPAADDQKHAKFYRESFAKESKP